MEYKKVTFAQVKSIIKKEGMFKGFIVGIKQVQCTLMGGG